MIVGNDLADNIIAKIENKKQNHQNIIATQITEYIIMNLQVMGIYNGILPIGSPDPLSGPVEFKVGCLIEDDMLINKSSMGFEKWYAQILNQIKLSTYTYMTLNGVLSPPIKVFQEIIPSQFSRPNGFQQSWKIVCKKIVNDLKMSVINGIPTNAIGAGGVGLVNLTQIK